MELGEWRDISHLRSGNERQKEAHQALATLGIFSLLADFDSTLVGTIPLGIDVAGSDLDIVCEVHDLEGFARLLMAAFGTEKGFRLHRRTHNELPSLVAKFEYRGFPIEVFGQPRPVGAQTAYRHMCLESRLLALGGEALRRAIRSWRRGGLKTEPAFARALGLEGDPFQALLDLEKRSDLELAALLRAQGFG